jgi:conjugal transfer pilus assembly protein TraV
VASGQTGAAYAVAAQNQGSSAISSSNNSVDQAKSALFTWNAPVRSAARDAPTSGQPIRSESDVLRVWIAPYEDDEGVLRDQAYAYVVLDNARWIIEHNQRRIMQTYAPVKAPASANKSVELEAIPANQGIVPASAAQ